MSADVGKCRLCLKNLCKRENKRTNVFLKIDGESSLSSAILSLFNIQLDEVEGWPREACKRCERLTREISAFRDEIKNSQCTLAAGNLPPGDDVKPELTPKADKDTLAESAVKSEQSIKKEEPPTFFANTDDEDEEHDADAMDDVANIEEIVVEEPLPVFTKKRYGLKPEKPERSQPQRRNKKSFVLKRNGARIYSMEEEDELEKHMLNMGLLTCHLCQAETDSLKQLHVHFREIHNQYAYIYCCNGKRRTGVQAFEHIQYHLNRSTFKCPNCGGNFKSRYNLKLHLSLYHADPAKMKYACTECDAKFNNKGKFNAHFKKHSKPVKCNYCGKGFNGKSHLKRHVERMHEIADRAVCDICGKWFSSACTLNIHLHRHKSQENKKTCPYCGKQVADLTQHVNVVHLGTRRGGIIKIPGQVIYPNRGEASQQVEILNVTEEQAAAAPPPGFQ